MRTIASSESVAYFGTLMGAVHYNAVLLDGEWVRVSDIAGRRYLGRHSGEERYEVDVADSAISARFYRPTCGNELVRASNGMEWFSFEEAARWAAEEQAPQTCPHCGRAM